MPLSLNPLNRGLSIQTFTTSSHMYCFIGSQSAQSRPQHSDKSIMERMENGIALVSIRSIAASAFRPLCLAILIVVLILIYVSIRSIAASAFRRLVGFLLRLLDSSRLNPLNRGLSIQTGGKANGIRQERCCLNPLNRGLSIQTNPSRDSPARGLSVSIRSIAASAFRPGRGFKSQPDDKSGLNPLNRGLSIQTSTPLNARARRGLNPLNRGLSIQTKAAEILTKLPQVSIRSIAASAFRPCHDLLHTVKPKRSQSAQSRPQHSDKAGTAAIRRASDKSQSAQSRPQHSDDGPCSGRWVGTGPSLNPLNRGLSIQTPPYCRQ